MLPKSASAKAEWDDKRDLFMLEQLLRALHLGRRSDNGFKKDVWTEIAHSFFGKFGLTLKVTQVQGRAQIVCYLLIS